MHPACVASVKVTLYTGAWYMVYVAPAMQEPNSAVGTPLGWMFKNALGKATVTQSELCVTGVQQVCLRAENNAI